MVKWHMRSRNTPSEMDRHGDLEAALFSVSVKAMVWVQSKVPLLLNEREEWELPGGKMEPDEPSQDCFIREVEEETGLTCALCSIVYIWIYAIFAGMEALIITCEWHAFGVRAARFIIEHKRSDCFAANEIPDLNIPEGYKHAILASRKD